MCCASGAAEYHVDGIHIVGYAPLETIVKDPYLADLKLWAKNWDEVRLEKGTDRSSRSKEERKVPVGVCLLTRQDLCWICAAS